MSDSTHAATGPETDAQRLERLIPVMGVENARRLVAHRITDGQRRRLAALVAQASPPVTSADAGRVTAGAVDLS